MDPTATLRSVYRAALRIQANELDQDNGYSDEVEFRADLETLTNGFINLHDWIMSGGFLPEQWQRKGR